MGIPSYFSYIVKNHPRVIRKLDKTFKVNNLYLGFVQIALQAAFSVLDKIPSTQFPLTTTIGVCVPII